MKRIIICLLVIGCILISLSACGKKESFDGRNRPSVSGALQVKNGILSDHSGNPVMLRGVSNPGVSISQIHTNEKTYTYMSHEMGINCIRLALYTHGTGSFGYCTGSDYNKESTMELLCKGVELAKEQDMYAIIDWHILDDGDPFIHLEDAKIFFDEISKKYASYTNVIYEICNEPNDGVDWQRIKDYADIIIPIIRANDADSVILIGTPEWSSQLDGPVANPLEYDNIMYTFHFYAASHKDNYRERVSTAAAAGLPIFISEYGIVTQTGNVPRDIDEANKWVDLLEESNISYVMWNFSKTGEGCAVLKYTCNKQTDFEEEDFTETGLWLIENLKNHK